MDNTLKNALKENGIKYDVDIKPIILDGEVSKYFITSAGDVISYQDSKKSNGKYHLLKNNITENGYCVVCLYHNDKKYWRYVHRLVAIAFIPIPEKYLEKNLSYENLEVNHKLGTFEGKQMNFVSNLEWVDSSENKLHGYRTSLYKRGENSPVAKYNDNQIHRVCELLQENELGNRDIWKQTGVSVNTIQMILAGKQWTHISKDYDFSNHKKRHILYDEKTKDMAKDMLENSDLSYKDIGDLIGMTRNAVWFIDKVFKIRS